MSNNWNRTKYDECRFKESIDETVSALNYRLYPGQTRTCDRCVSLNGPRGNGENTLEQPKDVVGIESKLKNIDGKYNSRSCKNDSRDFTNGKLNQNLVPICGDKLNPVSSRLNDPQMRGTTAWSYMQDFPQLSPQQNIYYYNEVGNVVNSRLQTKDLYDAESAICRESKKVMQQDPTLPKAKNISNDKCI